MLAQLIRYAKSTISYYLGNGQKEKAKNRNKKTSSKPEFVLQKNVITEVVLKNFYN